MHLGLRLPISVDAGDKPDPSAAKRGILISMTFHEMFLHAAQLSDYSATCCSSLGLTVMNP